MDASGKYGPWDLPRTFHVSHELYHVHWAHNSTQMYPEPYPSPLALMQRLDAAGEEWFQDMGPELHLSDFVFLTCMQSTCRMSQCTERFLGRDLVFERLMEEGIFDCCDPNIPHSSEESAMHHLTAMVQRLLMRVERLKAEVGVVLL